MQITLKVEELSVKLENQDKLTLNSICAHVKPGQVLAVMGPSGSGKTTFLSALSGRIKSQGRILLNGCQLNKSLRRQMCYVLQSDVFFPNLTLRQTLKYAAMLRMSDSMSHEAKMRAVDQVIEALDLSGCQDTPVGDFSTPGLSGGEKKRCSIACELLSNPSVMLLDEPTSSLDSCTALSLVKLLKDYAIREQKTIVMTVHQPSSQMFYMFDKLVLLSRGQLMYFGAIQHVLPFLNHFNLHMQHLSYNPADFLLEVSKSIDDGQLERMSAEARACFMSNYRRHSYTNHQNQLQLQSAIEQVHHHHHHGNHHQHQHAKSGARLNPEFVAPAASEAGSSPPPPDEKSLHNSNHDRASSSIHSSWSKVFIYEDSDNDSDSCNESDTSGGDHAKINKWPTTFCTQMRALTSRNFIESRARMMQTLNWVQSIGVALMSGLLWCQIARTEETLNDIKGWMYFACCYWSMVALYSTITAFPSEFQVISKERLAGSYRLSSYYVAKMIGELPLILTMPSVYHLISYSLLGFSNLYAFVGMWFYMMLCALASQSIGMFIGFAYGRLDVAITVGALYSTATTLFGGFYSNAIPDWLHWTRYGSPIYFGFLNMQMFEFSYGRPIRCAIKSTKYLSCPSGTNSTTSHSLVSSSHYVRTRDLLVGLDPNEPTDVPNPLWFNTLCLLLYIIVFRFLGYVVLRTKRKS